MKKMSSVSGRIYHIAEIFASLQGEGAHTGMAAVFVRFSGCNLSCSFCDTDFSARLHLSADQIVAGVKQAAGENPVRTVILTGGEPGLQVDAGLVDALHQAGLAIHVETNGTCPFPEGIDWITCSPKTTDVSQIRLQRADEVKVVFTWGGAESDSEQEISRYSAIINRLKPSSLRLQPCDTGEKTTTAANTRGAIAYILGHPEWRLSLQTHKYLDIR